MGITARTEKLLWGKAGATCSFHGCRKELVAEPSKVDGDVILGEVAHIVGQKRDGPRGNLTPPGGDLDAYDNLILLCEEHHKIIDGQPNTYTVLKLVQMKTDHERWVKAQLSKEKRFLLAYRPPEQLETETIYSTLLPVTKIPFHIYQAPCGLNEPEVKEKILPPRKENIMLPFIVRGGKLITFYNLLEQDNPFRKAIDTTGAEKKNSVDWWKNPDLSRWYMTLLNRSLNKLTGRKGLNLDKEHQRYYFDPGENGTPKRIKYRSLSGKSVHIQVARRPTFRHSGEQKNYWEHMAVGLQFHQVAVGQWCLSIRPERRFTRDGYAPLTPKAISRRSTSRKSRMYNINVLREVTFWRDYLSNGSPRIIFNFGTQAIVVNTEMMNTKISWPALPEESEPFKKPYFDDDLFSYAEFAETFEKDQDGLEEWDDDVTPLEEVYEPD